MIDYNAEDWFLIKILVIVWTAEVLYCVNRAFAGDLIRLVAGILTLAITLFAIYMIGYKEN